MSDVNGFDIDIDLSNAAWQPHMTGDCCAETKSLAQDQFNLDIKYNDVAGDPKTKDPLLGLSGFLGITCSNTCGVLSGCAGSGCGGLTCNCDATNGCQATNGCTAAPGYTCSDCGGFTQSCIFCGWL